MDKFKEIQSRISKYEEKHFLYHTITLIILLFTFILLTFGLMYLVLLMFFGKSCAIFMALVFEMIILLTIIDILGKNADNIYDRLWYFINKFSVFQQIIRNMDAEYTLMWHCLQNIKITEDNYKELSETLSGIVPAYYMLYNAIPFDISKFAEWYLEHVVILDSFAKDYFSRNSDIMNCIKTQYCCYKHTYKDWGEEFNNCLNKFIQQAHVESKLNEVKIRNLLEDERKLQEKLNYYKANSLEYKGV
ncbi:hypothetical protein [Butyrivibrio sp.]|uniref:hypothetical protein n=1 Tax=Butyrivibrio sp. TaxID=28121 RepID=UPI0025BC5441|nr:hypothetical protein [Butyrivibrio sp.]MBQ7431319.1 hypothetical protein [Butyrivibrio sp.]MBQ9302741.1 hypothetical protein [Butyrivibrio sp.]